jgi:predicted GNAT superfamily acetyltransferase
MTDWIIHLLETPEYMAKAEALQRLVWTDSETDVIPTHMLMAVVHNGGLGMGAFVGEELVGFAFGFAGLIQTPDGPLLKHHSHILGVHPAWSGKGIGFALKRAQWQMVRRQGIDRITWTYDPLLSRNAHLNIARLGAVCSTYLRSEYGIMRDGLNAGLPSDRFQVDWWLNSRRVERRLSRRASPPLTLDHYRSAGAILYEGHWDGNSNPRPPTKMLTHEGSLVLVENPPDYLVMKSTDLPLGRDWRFFGREFFETAFGFGYLVTDFIRDGGRCFYLLTHGEATL